MLLTLEQMLTTILVGLAPSESEGNDFYPYFILSTLTFLVIQYVLTEVPTAFGHFCVMLVRKFTYTYTMSTK